MRAYGMVHSEKFSWPHTSQIRQLDLTKVIKLCGIELGMTSNLFQIRLHFTGGIRSPNMRAEGSAAQQGIEDSDHGYRMLEIDPSKQITDVYFSQNAKTGMIYGLRIVDNKGQRLVDEQWNKFQAISDFLPDQNIWRHFKVPPGSEIIGCHGSTD